MSSGPASRRARLSAQGWVLSHLLRTAATLAASVVFGIPRRVDSIVASHPSDSHSLSANAVILALRGLLADLTPDRNLFGGVGTADGPCCFADSRPHFTSTVSSK